MATHDVISADERRRYSRTILLNEIGECGQRRLLGSTVAIVGAGALGSVVAMYLAASGAGTLRIADFDTVDISNLQRQLSFVTGDCGRRKTEATALRIKAINPDISVEITDGLLSRGNISEFVAGADLVIEGSDNPSTKYLVSDHAVEAGIPYVLGGVSQWSGQVTSWRPGHMSYRDIFPEQASEGSFMPCSLGGVLGPLPGIIGSVMATEAIKIITGAGLPLYDRIWLMDALTMTSRVISL